jgi:hypothetical protein
MRTLLVLALFFYQDNPSPFSKDYKGGGGGGSGAPKKGGASASSKKPGNTPAALKAAIEWLLKNQQKDGSWDTRLGGETGTVVVTSWCGLALMATGENKDPWTKAAKYVAARILNKSHNPDPKWDQTNWQVAIGGMFLAEYVAETKDAEVKAVLEKVADEIGKRMEPSGGYGHCKGVKNALNYIELEVMSNWMMAAAGMCRRLNIKVSGDMGRAMSFVENCCSPGGGNVGYSPGPGQKGVGCPCRTGGAIFAFACLKAQSNGLYAKMAEYYKKAIDKSNEGHGSLAMGLLESALGARTLGSDVWDAYVSKFFPQILSHANADGSFKHITGKTMQSIGGDNMTGPAYPTGIFALILQLDLGNLTFVGQRNN